MVKYRILCEDLLPLNFRSRINVSQTHCYHILQDSSLVDCVFYSHIEDFRSKIQNFQSIILKLIVNVKC